MYSIYLPQPPPDERVKELVDKLNEAENLSVADVLDLFENPVRMTHAEAGISALVRTAGGVFNDPSEDWVGRCLGCHGIVLIDVPSTKLFNISRVPICRVLLIESSRPPTVVLRRRFRIVLTPDTRSDCPPTLHLSLSHSALDSRRIRRSPTGPHHRPRTAR